MEDTKSNVREHNAKPKADEVVAAFDHVEERWEDATDRVPVFSIVKPNPKAGEPIEGSDADDYEGPVNEPASITVTHTMPRKPNAGLGLAYLKQARRQGPDVAASWLIETAVGPDAYDDLVDELSGAGLEGDKILEHIVAKIQTIALGGLEAPKG